MKKFIYDGNKFSIPVFTDRVRRPIQGYIDENGCWICTSHKKHTDDHVKLVFKGERILIVKYLWKKYKKCEGTSENMYFHHKCKNPSCVNLEHVYLSPLKPVRKDRRGENAHNVKLNEEQVRRIKKDERKNLVIALSYRVSEGAIASIKSGRTWKHVE